MNFWDRKGFWEVSADDGCHFFWNPDEVTEDHIRTGRHHYLVPNGEAVAGLGPLSMVSSLERRCGTIPTGGTRDG